MPAQPSGFPFFALRRRDGFRLNFERCVCVDQIRSDESIQEQEPLSLSLFSPLDPISCKNATPHNTGDERASADVKIVKRRDGGDDKRRCQLRDDATNFSRIGSPTAARPPF